MKKTKLMALGLMVMMIQSVGAVTLPSTSYSPYAAGGASSGGSESVVFSSGSIVSGSYISLGDYPETDVCTGDTPGFSPEGDNCTDCCAENFPCSGKAATDECWELHRQCISSCMAGPSLPLDGGLTMLLALALGSGAVRMFKSKKPTL